MCEYELEYIIEGKHREAYFAQRDDFLAKMGRAEEVTFQTFRKFPGDDCAQRGKYLEFETKGAGAFGWIIEGVDTNTGDPVAIKRVQYKRPEERHQILREVNFGMRFHVSLRATEKVF